MPILHRDFETRSFADLKRVGAQRYAADSTTEVVCICYAIDDGPIESFIPGSDKPIPEVFKEAANNPEWSVAAHNDAFESAIEDYVLRPRYNWPLVPIERHICSMATAQYHGLPGALEKIAAILALPVQKDQDGKRLMLRLAKPKRASDGTLSFIEPTPEELARLIEYCVNDVMVEREALRRLPPLPAQEVELWRLDRRINSRGFCVDLELADAANRLARLEAARINSELLALTDGAVRGFTKVNDIIAFVNAQGHGMTKLNKRAVAAVRAHKPDWVSDKTLELRQAGANITVSKFAAVSASAFPDRRVRGILHYYGAHTGRWTSSGLNPHNLPREDRADAAAVIAAVRSGDLDRVRAFGHPIEAIAGIARGLVTAPPGKRLLIGDFSTLESRITAWYAQERWKLENFKNFDATGDPKLDPYCQLASRLLQREVAPDDTEARQRGKTADLAFGFAGSVGAWRRFMDDPRSDEEIKAKEVNAFRDLHPATVRLWYAIEHAALDCVRSGMPVPRSRFTFEIDQNNTLQLVLPSGRRLFYPQAEIDRGRFGDCIFYRNTAQALQRKLTEQEQAKGKIELGRTSLVENLVSATGRDLLVNALMKLNAAGFEIVLHVHDEILAEVDAEKADAEPFKRCMLDVPEWALDLPLMAKVRSGERYIKTDAPIKIDAAIEIPMPNLAPAESPLPVEPPISAGSSIETSAAPIGGIAEPRVAAPPIDAAPFFSAEATAQTFSSGNGNGRTTWANESYGAGRNRHSSDGNVHGDNGPQRGQRTGQWIYRHLDQPNYLRVDRYDLPNGDRKFYQHHWSGTYWVLGVKGTYAERKIPYRLPELKAALQANPDVELQICEGESDADTVARLGFVTTTNPGGALSWTPELTSWLRILGVRRATIHEDNDDKGRKRSTLLTAELSNFIKLKLVRYPEVPEGEDVRWWIERGHTKEELAARIAAAESATPPFPFINMSNWDCEPVPEQQWIVFGRIPRRQSVIFFGEGGAGKSIIQLHLSAATVLGRDWLGATPEQGPALFIDCEDDQDVMHYRLAAIARHYDTCFTNLINGGLHLTSLVGQDTVLATVSRSGVVEPTALCNRLLQAAGDIKPTMIGIAASANVFAGDENNRSQVQQFINLTTRLAIVANGALVLITHPSITGINTGSGLSGSTQWHNAVRARFFLKSPKAEPGELPDNELREIEFKKNQYGAMAENIPLRWQDGMFLPIDGATFNRAEQEVRADEVFLELLRRFSTENRYVSSSQGPTYAPALFAKEDKARKAGTNSISLAAAMRRLFDAGKIYNEPHGKPSRPRFHLAIKP